MADIEFLVQQSQRLGTQPRNTHQLDQARRNAPAFLFVAFDFTRPEVLFDRFRQVFANARYLFELSLLCDRSEILFEVPNRYRRSLIRHDPETILAFEREDPRHALENSGNLCVEHGYDRPYPAIPIATWKPNGTSTAWKEAGGHSLCRSIRDCWSRLVSRQPACCYSLRPGLNPIRILCQFKQSSTVEARHDHDKAVPSLKQEDVMVYERRERLKVTELVPFPDNNAGLDLFILLDNASSASLGSQLADLRQFIETQPVTTAIGIGYMRNGTYDMTQSLTTDRAHAAHSLRIPLSSAGVMARPD